MTNTRDGEVTIPLQKQFVTAAIVMLLLTVPSGSLSQQTNDVQVIILSPSTTDIRISLTREAIAFWNETFAALQLRLRLRESDMIVTLARSRAFENYARQISQRAGRFSAGPDEPDPPVQVVEIGGDVVVLLSRQDIMSFAWPLPRSTRYFVAIETGPNSAAANQNVARNVIAHELGHTIGLTHNNDPTTLMCGPCRPSLLKEDEPAFLPLTPLDLERLVKLHPRIDQ